MRLFLTFALIVLALMVGCGETIAPESVESVVLGEVEVGDEISFINFGRECGDPGNGWIPFGELQPPGCDQYYYMIDGNKGIICGPPGCATNEQMTAMYRYLIVLIEAQNTTMHEVS